MPTVSENILHARVFHIIILCKRIFVPAVFAHLQGAFGCLFLVYWKSSWFLSGSRNTESYIYICVAVISEKCLGWLVTSWWRQKGGFSTRQVDVRFIAGTATFWLVSLQVLRFSPISIILQIIHIHSHIYDRSYMTLAVEIPFE